MMLPVTSLTSKPKAKPLKIFKKSYINSMYVTNVSYTKLSNLRLSEGQNIISNIISEFHSLKTLKTGFLLITQ